MTHRITGRTTVWEHENQPFRIDKLTVTGNGDTEPMQWTSYERGNSVAALIVNTDTKNVILIQQFRPPVAAVEGPDHKLLETAAGMIRQNEEVLQCLQREVEEETGHELAFDPATGTLANTEFIGSFYSSPGGSSELIHLYYVTVTGDTAMKPGGGMREDGEIIETVLMPLDEFFLKIDRAEFKDPKIIIAGQWLEKRWGNRRTTGDARQTFEIAGNAGPGERRRAKPRVVGYCVGDISKIDHVDVWVNSSNTEFLMDSVYHRTLSARIRMLGARVSGDVMVEDTIQRAIERRLGIGKGVKIGMVLDTEPGALAAKNNVRRLFHVASIGARIGPHDVKTISSIDDLENCVRQTLAKCDDLNRRRRWWLGAPYRSILLPLFGAGIDRDSSEFRTQRICNALIPTAVQYFEDHPKSRIEEVYFLAYTPMEVEVCDSVMSRHRALRRIATRDPSEECGKVDTAGSGPISVRN